MRIRKIFSFFPIREYTYTFEQEAMLWRVVLDRALRDFDYKGAAKRKLKAKLEVEEWLDSEDFETVCDLADIPKSMVLYVFQKYKEDPTWEPPLISTLSN